MKQFTGILIDAQNRTITHVTVSDEPSSYHKVMDCDCFTTGFNLPNRDICFVDDEGMINGTDVFFEYEGAHQPFAGNGLIVGGDSHGNGQNARISIEDVRAKVKFYSLEEIRAKFKK